MLSIPNGSPCDVRDSHKDAAEDSRLPRSSAMSLCIYVPSFRRITSGSSTPREFTLFGLLGMMIKALLFFEESSYVYPNSGTSHKT